MKWHAALLMLWIGLPSAMPSTLGANAVAAARTFLAMLDARQFEVVRLELTPATWSKWSNLPSAPGYRELRNGIPMGELNKRQQDAALGLVETVLSPAGYRKVLDILNAEEVRMRAIAGAPEHEGDGLFRYGEFQFAVLGEPSMSQPWMIQMGGHHLGLNITIVGDAIELAPLHTGTEPFEYKRQGHAIRPLGNEHDKALALMNALNEGNENW